LAVGVKKKAAPKGSLIQYNAHKRAICGGSTLTGFEPALRFVDHVNAALATHNATITVPVFERAERIANFHVLILPVWALPSVREGPAPGYGRPLVKGQ
jgi:hypothetical protein